MPPRPKLGMPGRTPPTTAVPRPTRPVMTFGAGRFTMFRFTTVELRLMLFTRLTVVLVIVVGRLIAMFVFRRTDWLTMLVLVLGLLMLGRFTTFGRLTTVGGRVATAGGRPTFGCAGRLATAGRPGTKPPGRCTVGAAGRWTGAGRAAGCGRCTVRGRGCGVGGRI